MLKAAGEILAASVDFEVALRNALQHAPPGFADWCAIDYYGSDGDLRTVHSGYPDARQEHLILEIRRRYRAERGENGDVLAALHSSEVLLYPDMTQIASVRLSPDEQELLGELDALLAQLEDQAIEAAGHQRDDIAMLAIRRSG
jgi:hypothetical protein